MSDNIEFYIYEGELWCKDDKGGNILVDSTKNELLDIILSRVKECYPEAYNALCERYKDSAPNHLYYKYMMAKRFVRCNFAPLDSTAFDIEKVNADMHFNFERVDCPIRGECKYDGVICSPRFNASLSIQEMKVCRLWYEGLSKEEIGGVLFLSPDTINNHIRNAYYKLGVHGKAEFVKFAEKNGIFR